jgi:hypothetical protein
MHPDDQALPRLSFSRNRDALLFGLSWSHHSSFSFRTTHFYLGLWVFTVRTGLSVAHD